MNYIPNHELPHVEDAEAETRRAARAALLEAYAEDHRNPAIWQQAYDMVRQEGDTVPAGLETTAAADIPAEGLIAFADAMRATPQSGRYALTTGLAPDGRRWFDVLRTFSLDQSGQARLAVLEQLASEGYEFNRALDLGTGTGKSLEILETVAGQVVGFDRNPDLLGVAAENKADNTQLVLGDATNLPFQDKSFDLISSRGLEGALSDADNEKLYHEIGRVLRPGGVYVTSYTMANEDGYKGYEMESICLTAKAMLADMVVDSISGGLEVGRNLEPEDFTRIIQDAGLDIYGMTAEDESDGVTHVVSLLIKRML